MPASRPTWPWPESGGWPGRAVATGSTRLAGVIGDPVGHSLSPALHNAAFEALGLDWVYLAFPVAAGRVGGAVEAVRALGIAGLNVTMPHKAAVLPHLDRVSPTVAALGAANTLVPAGGGVVGESTDGDGFLDSLRMDLGFEPEGCRCLVVGAGGAARAVILALSRAGARQVLVANRTPARAEEAVALAAGVGRAARAGPGTPTAGTAGRGTPGPGIATAGSPVPSQCLGPGQLVVDLVYRPERTELLAQAARRGARTANGLPMLVRQAARSFRLWTGLDAPVEAMWAAAREGLVEGPATGPDPGGSPPGQLEG